MTFCLDSIIIKPEEGTEIKNAIILLHGYGGDGNDISMLTLNWKRHLPNTVFICPNGHETCPINPSGYQWFDLTKEDSSYILEQSLKAEEKIKQFIGEIKKEFNLSNDKICLSGFSQGCMMSLNVGLTSEEKFLCIIGFSGKIINKVSVEFLILNFKLSLSIIFPEKPMIHKNFSSTVKPTLSDIIQPWLNPDKHILSFVKLNSFLISSINFLIFSSAFNDCSSI